MELEWNQFQHYLMLGSPINVKLDLDKTVQSNWTIKECEKSAMQSIVMTMESYMMLIRWLYQKMENNLHRATLMKMEISHLKLFLFIA